MAARNKPAGIRSLVYGIGKSKADIEGLSVSGEPTGSFQIRPAPDDGFLGVAIGRSRLLMWSRAPDRPGFRT